MQRKDSQLLRNCLRSRKVWFVAFIVSSMGLVVSSLSPRASIGVLRGHADLIRCIAFSPDGVTVAAGGKDGAAILWDLATMQRRFVLRGHTDSVLALAFSSDSKLLATASRDGTVKVWECPSGILRDTIARLADLDRDPILAVAFSPDNRCLAYGGQSSTVTVWDMVSAKQESLLTHHPWHVCSLAYSPDGKMLVSRGTDGIIKVWSVVDRRVSQTRA